MKVKTKKGQWFRYSVQGGFLLFMLAIGYLHSRYGGGSGGYPSVHAICPFGGAETFAKWITSGDFLRRTSFADIIILSTLLGLTLLLGRVFCGAMCPLGTLQEWGTSLGGKLGIKRKELSPWIDRPLRLMKYVVLAVIIFRTWKIGTLIFNDYCPWATILHLFHPLEVIEERPIGLLIVVAILLSTLFVERAFCRYFCPLGGLLSIVQRFSLVHVRRDDDACINCGACDRVCPMGLDISLKSAVKSPECIQCGRCTDTCPVEGALQMGMERKRTAYWKVLLAFLLIFFSVYGYTKVSGIWSTSTKSRTVEQIQQSEKQLITDEIRGKMTLNEILELYSLDGMEILKLAGWPEDTPRDRPLKEIKAERPELELEVSAIREAVRKLLEGY